MDTKPEFVENLDDCTLHYGVDMSSLRFDPPHGQKIGLRMGEKIVRAVNSHDELVAALESAYLILLSHRQDSWRISNQHVYCLLRDSIAKATGREAEDVQNSFEERAAIAKAKG